MLRYIIASLLLSGNFEPLSDVVLPVVQQEKSKYSDVFTRFVEALYDQFDFAQALVLAKELGKAASEDLLLKNHAADIQAQAAILVFQVKSKLYKTVDLRELIEESGIKSEDEVRARLEESIKKEGFSVEYDSVLHSLTVSGQLKDAKVKIYNKTADLVKRTN